MLFTLSLFSPSLFPQVPHQLLEPLLRPLPPPEQLISLPVSQRKQKPRKLLTGSSLPLLLAKREVSPPAQSHMPTYVVVRSIRPSPSSVPVPAATSAGCRATTSFSRAFLSTPAYFPSAPAFRCFALQPRSSQAPDPWTRLSSTPDSSHLTRGSQGTSLLDFLLCINSLCYFFSTSSLLNVGVPFSEESGISSLCILLAISSQLMGLNTDFRLTVPISSISSSDSSPKFQTQIQRPPRPLHVGVYWHFTLIPTS